ncbi:MAG: NAD(P)/FAD-dependent oxidoreductase [Nitrospirae bacterium]|nr:NAD(P)/FAD-dependent oxidoreductase [Nitrospirota bacterium]
MEGFDYIIIGAGTGGLAAFSLLSKNGKKVVVIDEKESAGGSASVSQIGGYQFPQGPLLFLGLDKGIFPIAFSKAGINNLKSQISENVGAIHELPLQIVLPEQRINLYSDRQELLEELNRVFPDKVDAIRMFYNKVDEIAEIAKPLFLPLDKDDKGFERILRLSKEKARIFFSTAKYGYEKASKFLYGYGLDAAFKRFIDMQTLLVLQKTTNEINLLSLAEALTFLKMDASTIRDGFNTISKAMADSLAKAGSSIRYNTRIKEIIQVNNQFYGVRLEDGSQLEADYLILNVPHVYLQKDKGKQRVVYIIYMAADEDALPAAMKDNLAMSLDLSKFPLDENFMYVSIVPDNSRQPEGRRGLKINMFVERDVLSDSEKLAVLRDEAIKQIRWLMPFSDNRLYYIGDNSEDYIRQEKFAEPFELCEPFKPYRLYPNCFKSFLKHCCLISDFMPPSAGTGRELLSAVRFTEKICRR